MNLNNINNVDIFKQVDEKALLEVDNFVWNDLSDLLEFDNEMKFYFGDLFHKKLDKFKFSKGELILILNIVKF